MTTGRTILGSVDLALILDALVEELSSTALITIGTVAPANPVDGQLWIDTR